MNIDPNNITQADLWFARFVWFMVGLIVGGAVIH